MNKYFDIEKHTIIEILKANIDDLHITDDRDSMSKEDKNSAQCIFVEKIAENKYKICDYNSYDKYGKIIDTTFDFDIVGCEIVDEVTGEPTKILSLDNSSIVVEKPFSHGMAEGDSLTINKTNSTKDRMVIRSLYTYDNTDSAQTISVYRRFDLRLFVQDDVKDDKSNYYIGKVKKSLKGMTSYPLIEEDGTVNNSKLLYIQDGVVFDIEYDNNDNKIIQGTVLVKTFHKNK